MNNYYTEETPDQYLIPELFESISATPEQIDRMTKFKQKIGDLKNQDDQFIDWIVRKVMKYDYLHCGTRRDKEIISLRYTGNDKVTVRRLFDSFIRCHLPDFVIDKSTDVNVRTNEKVIEYLVKIYCGESDRNGLVLRGGVGSGKTCLIRTWIFFRKSVLYDSIEKNSGKRLKDHCFYTSSRLISLYEQFGFRLFDIKHGELLVLDDIQEMTDANRYGIKTNVFEQMILSRYDQFKSNPTLETYCTTNLTSELLEKIIGQRAISRLDEMTNWNDGLLIAPDRRKTSHVIQWFDQDFYNPTAKLKE